MEKVILMVGDKPRAMCKAEERDLYERMFSATEVVEGKFKKGKPNSNIRARVSGLFTANDGREFLVYTDWSVNKIEDTDAAGFPK